MVLAIVVGKIFLVFVSVRACGGRTQSAAATGLCLAQVGEFSFVLATIAYNSQGDGSILSDRTFRALVAATIISLLITPYLIAAAPWAGAWIERRWRRLFTGATQRSDRRRPRAVQKVTNLEPGQRNWIFIIGFGPAGQRVAEDLLTNHQDQLVVVDINADNIQIAERYGLMVRWAMRRRVKSWSMPVFVVPGWSSLPSPRRTPVDG